MFIDILFCRRVHLDPSSIRVVVEEAMAFREDNKFLTGNLVLFNCLANKDFRHALRSAEKRNPARLSRYQQYPKSECPRPKQPSIKAKICLRSTPILPKHQCRTTCTPKLIVSNCPISNLLTLDTFNPLFPKRQYFIVGFSPIFILRSRWIDDREIDAQTKRNSVTWTKCSGNDADGVP